MITRRRLARKIDSAADRVPLAIATLAELATAIEDDQPARVLLDLVHEIRDALLQIEDAVGVRTPATLFDEEPAA